MADDKNFENSIGKLNDMAKTGLKGIKTVTDVVVDLSVAATKVGMNFENSMSKVQAMSGTTENGLTELIKKVNEINNLGISLIDGDGKVKETKALYDELREKFKGLTDEQKKQSAATIFGKESMSEMIAILNASDEEYKSFNENLNNSSSAIENMGATMQDNLSSSIGQVDDGLKELGVTAYEKFKEPIKKATEVAKESVDSLNSSLKDGELGESVDKVSKSFGELVEGIGKVINKCLPKLIDGFTWILNNSSKIVASIIFIGTSLAVLNIANIIMKLVRAFKDVKTAAEAWAVVQKLLNIELSINTVVLIVAAIAGLIAAIVYLWKTNEDFRNAVIGAWNAILEAGKAVWEWLINFFTVTIPEAWQAVVDFFVGIPDWFVSLWDTIKQAFLDGWNSIVEFFIETIPEWIDQIFNWFNELPYKIGYALGCVIGTVIKWGQDIWEYLVTNVPIWIENVVTFFSELPEKIWIWLVDTFNKIVTWGCQVYTNMTNTVTNAINTIIDWFSRLPGRIWEWLSNTISKIAEFASNALSKSIEAGSNIVNGIIDTITGLPSKVFDIGVNIVKGLWDGITSMWGWITNKVGGFFKGVVDGIKDTLGIHSPSRVMRDQVGKYLAQGIGVGFEDESSDLENTIEKDLSSLVGKMQMAVDYNVASTTAGIVASRNIPSEVSTVTHNNDNGLNVNIESFVNNRKQDVREFAEELEFYRGKLSVGKGGV